MMKVFKSSASSAWHKSMTLKLLSVNIYTSTSSATQLYSHHHNKNPLFYHTSQLTHSFSKKKHPHQHDHDREDGHGEETKKHASPCWKCGHQKECCQLFCKNCGKIQPIEGNCCNYFEILQLPTKFNISKTALESNFKNIQKNLHPDKHSNSSTEEKNVSTYTSSVINQAYQALKCPVDRAQYLLKLQGKISSFDEKETLKDPVVMLEIFNLREEIEEVSTLSEGKEIHNKIDIAMVHLYRDLLVAFDENRYEDAYSLLVKFKYYSKAKDELEDKFEELHFDGLSKSPM